MEYYAFALNNWFPPVLPQVSNSELFFEAIRCDVLGDQVVTLLKQIEKSPDGHNWHHDKELIRLFDKMIKSGIITLPNDPVDRIRWIAIMCILFSEQRQFSWGNVIMPLDYEPDENLEDYWDRYGAQMIDDTRKFRGELKKKGWKSLL